MAESFGVKMGVEGEKEFKNALKEINSAFKVLGSEMNLVTSQFDKNDKSIQSLSARNGVLTKEIEAQKNKVQTLQAALENASSSFGEADSRTRSWQIQLNNAQADLNKMESELKANEDAIDRLGQEMEEAEEQTDDFAESLSDSGDMAEDSSGKFEKVGSVVAGVGTAIAAAAAAIGAAVVVASVELIKLGDEYNKAVNQISASTGATGTELEELGVIAQKVYTNNFGDSLEDVAEGLSVVQKTTGLVGDELQKATESGFALRDTFGYDLQESARAANALMKNFGVTAEEAYNIIAVGAQNGADQNGDLLDTLNEYSAQYSALGLSADKFVTGLINGAEAGVFSIDKVGDAVKEFNLRAKDGSNTTIEAFQALGMNADEMTKRFAAGGESAEEAFFEVVNALNNMDDPIAKNTAAVNLFGTQFEDLQANVLPVLAGMKDGAAASYDALSQINEIKYADLDSALEGTKRSIEGVFLPTVSQMSAGITDVFSTLGNAINEANGDFNGWSGTTASTRAGKLGKFFRFNTVNPATEKTHLRATNTGDFFTALGKRIVAGGWIYPTTYSVGTTFVPIFSTRSGPGNPLFYLSLRSGRLRNMLYDSSGTLIHDVIEPEPMGVVLKNNGAYFIGTVIDLEKKTVQSLVCDRGTGDVFKTAIRSFTGELNPSCTADIVMGMYADSYYFAGGFDDWFYETDSDLTIDDLKAHFLSGLLANGADVDSSVDAISNLGSVTLKQTDGVYAESGVLYTRILDLGEGGLAGAGKIQLVGTVDAGITSISEVRTRTSDSLEDTSFSDWEAVGADGVIQSPNLRYIQIQMTLSTTDTSMTPELSAIQIYETPKAPYSKLGYARPVVLSDGGIREAVLENAYDIIVTSELNGSDYLEFSIPFKDGKRSYLDNEKKLQITKDIYRIRTVTDDKGEDGKTVTSIYAEAAFYDLAYSEKKSEQTYEAETAEKPMAYALQGTGWSVGKITVSTKRSWQSMDKNALSMLRTIQSIYGGDLEFDNVNKQVSLLTQSGSNSGAVFAYRKNMKSIQRVVDTRSLVTRLYAYGADGMTFASIN